MSKKRIYLDLIEEEKELLETLDKVRGLKKYYEETFGYNEPQKKIEFTHDKIEEKQVSSDLYNSRWSHREKAEYGLKILGSATSQEVAREILKHDSSLDYHKTYKSIRSAMSNLVKKDKVGVVLDENGANKYYLK